MVQPSERREQLVLIDIVHSMSSVEICGYKLIVPQDVTSFREDKIEPKNGNVLF